MKPSPAKKKQSPVLAKSNKAKATKKKTEKIPPEMLEFVKQIKGVTSEELILRAIPNADPKRISGLTAGFHPHGKSSVPDWVSKASCLMLGGFGLDLLKDLETKPFQVWGKTVELGRSTPKKQLKKMGVSFESLFDCVETHIGKSSPENLQQYAEGRLKISNSFAKMEQPSQRANIYALIAIRWVEVAKLKSTSELFKWLLSHNSKEEQFISPDTDSREIRAICKSIGLRFYNRGGRPRKKSTT